MSNSMEYETWELLEKMLDEINMLLISYGSKKITAEQFITEVKYLKQFYENEIH